jgi:hypothetical protein
VELDRSSAGFFVGISFLRLLNSGNSCEFRAAEPGKSHSDRPNPEVDESFEHHFAPHALILSKSRPKLASISEASLVMPETRIYFRNSPSLCSKLTSISIERQNPANIS